MKILQRIFCAVLGAGLFYATPALSAINVSVSVDKSYLAVGENGQMVALSATSDETRSVDVYFGLIGPGGTIYTMPNLAADLSPWLTDVALPAGYNLAQTEFFDAASVPGGLTPGIWQAAIGLTDAGTNNFFVIEVAPFQVVSSAASGDGVTYGVLSLDHDGNTGAVNASALFGSYSGTLGDVDNLVEGLTSNEAALEQCVLNEYAFDGTIPDISDLQFNSMDAGDPLTITLANSSHNLDKEQEQFMQQLVTSYNKSLQSSFFQSGTVSFQGFGGPQVAAFTASAPAPEPLTLSAPSAQTSTHSAANNLGLSWTGADGTGEVRASLSGTDASFSKTVEIVCRFIDDGSAVIPADKISDMQQRLSAGNVGSGGGSVNIPGVGEIDIPDFDFGNIPGFGALSSNLTVQRSSYSVFNTSNNGLDFGVVTINSDATRMLSLTE